MDSNRLAASADEPDPWASPSNTFKSSPVKTSRPHESLANGSKQQRTTSAYSTAAGNDDADNPSKAAHSTESTGSGAEWGGDDPGSPGGAGFGAGDLTGNGGFGGGTTAGSNEQPPPFRGGRAFARRQVSQGAQEILTVSALPEKEGMFMFQYRNYEISSNRRSTKVIRRYSDFVWLLDCLHKRYPFRQLPLLPPKRVASMTKYQFSMCALF